MARPIVAFASTLGTDLTRGERAFVGWMAPRGIVAAATASTFTAGLVARGSAGHDLMFLVRADGQLTAVTQTETPVPQAGDTMVSLGPVPVAQATDGRRPA